MDSAPEPSGFDSSVLVALSIGLGSMAALLAGIALYLLLKNQGAFQKARYRSNHSITEHEADLLEP